MRESLLAVHCYQDKVAGCCIHYLKEPKGQLLFLCRYIIVFCTNCVHEQMEKLTLNRNIITLMSNNIFLARERHYTISTEHIIPPQKQKWCLCECFLVICSK